MKRLLNYVHHVYPKTLYGSLSAVVLLMVLFISSLTYTENVVAETPPTANAEQVLIAEQAEEIKRLKAELASVKAELKESQDANASYVSVNSNLEQENAALTLSVDTLEKQTVELRISNATLTNDNTNKETLIRVLSTQANGTGDVYNAIFN